MRPKGRRGAGVDAAPVPLCALREQAVQPTKADRLIDELGAGWRYATSVDIGKIVGLSKSRALALVTDLLDSGDLQERASLDHGRELRVTPEEDEEPREICDFIEDYPSVRAAWTATLLSRLPANHGATNEHIASAMFGEPATNSQLVQVSQAVGVLRAAGDITSHSRARVSIHVWSGRQPCPEDQIDFAPHPASQDQLVDFGDSLDDACLPPGMRGRGFVAAVQTSQPRLVKSWQANQQLLNAAGPLANRERLEQLQAEQQRIEQLLSQPVSGQPYPTRDVGGTRPTYPVVDLFVT